MLTTTGTFRCALCAIAEGRIWLRNEHAIAINDKYPLADGHTLVLPRRHVPRLFDLPPDEYAALWQLVAEARAELVTKLDPDGFNVAVNDGPAAGQTIMHCHVHIIPRRIGDSPDPRGGVRWVLPQRAPYWEQIGDDDLP